MGGANSRCLNSSSCLRYVSVCMWHRLTYTCKPNSVSIPLKFASVHVFRICRWINPHSTNTMLYPAEKKWHLCSRGTLLPLDTTIHQMTSSFSRFPHCWSHCAPPIFAFGKEKSLRKKVARRDRDRVYGRKKHMDSVCISNKNTEQLKCKRKKRINE